MRFWTELVAAGSVPDGTVYEEFPRSRVNFDTKTGKFHLYADRCITTSPEMIYEITARFRLPGRIKAERDPHYLCRICAGDDWVPLLDA